MTDSARFGIWAFGTSFVLGALGCAHERTRADARDPVADHVRHHEVAPIGGGPVEGADPGRTSVRSALNSMARARCDREEKCNNVGSGQKYGTYDRCCLV